MSILKLHDRYFKPFIEAEQIRQTVASLAFRIRTDFEGQHPVFLVVLNGAFLFAADLIREVNLPCRVEFVRISSYQGTASSGIIHQTIALPEIPAGVPVILVEDIIETGLSLDHLFQALAVHGHRPYVASLLLKPQSYQGSRERVYRFGDRERVCGRLWNGLRRFGPQPVNHLCGAGGAGSVKQNIQYDDYQPVRFLYYSFKFA